MGLSRSSREVASSVKRNILSADPEQDIMSGEVGEVGLAHSPMGVQFNMMRILAFGFNTSNSWLAIATSLPLAISAGGTVALLYGIIVVAFALGCTGLSLAELASVYPTVGGQYHFTSIIAPRGYSKSLSYICGLVGIFAWIAIASSVALVNAQFILAIAVRFNPGYVAKKWHYFLVYQAVHIVAVFYNTFLSRKSAWIYTFGCKYICSHFTLVSVSNFV